jgi:signal transduction histidine kinase/DNA-binding NarL/FixJ family response regulator
MQRTPMWLHQNVSDQLRCYLTAIALLLFMQPLHAADGERDIAEGLIRSVPEKATLILTPEEQTWLADHPMIVFGGALDLPPFNFIAANGLYQGYNADLVNIINESIGSDIKIVAGEWAGLQENVRQREIDGLLGPSFTAERSQYMVFTEPYIDVPNALFTLEDYPQVSGIGDFDGRTIAIHEGSSSIEFFEKNFPGVRIRKTQNHLEALLSVSTRQNAAAYMGLSAGLYEININVITNLRAATVIHSGDVDMRLGIRSDWPQLASILQKALDSIADTQWQRLSQKWIGSFDTPEPIGILLTEQERLWLRNHPVVSVLVDSNAAPVEFRSEDGQYRGISMEYLDRLEELLGIRLEVAEGVGWVEGLEEVSNKRLDMVSSIAITEQRKQLFLFTKAFNFMPVKIFARNDISFIGTLDNLTSQKVAVPGSSPLARFITRDYPDVTQVSVKTPTEGLEMLSNGEVDAFVDNMVSASYYIGKLRLNNVRIAGETPYSHDQAMAVRKDWPVFAAILQKALDAIDQQQRQTFYNRWMSIRYEVEADYSILWQSLLAAAAILTLFIYWNRRLAREIVARQQTEISLQAAKEAADLANRAKSTFLANMSHELRTPLNAVLGFSELMARDQHASSDQKENLGVINRSGQHLLSLINNVLDMSKVEAGRTELEPEYADLCHLLQDIGDMFRLRAETKDLAFTLELTPSLPQYVLLDMGKLRQVFINLLGNAVTFTEAGGVALRADADELPNGNWQLRFEVADTGIGIPADEVETIFEPFAQAGRSPAKHHGTGLGLAISRQFIQLMGGDITVESTPGEGSVFRFELPADAADATNVAQPHEETGQRVVGLATNEPEWRILIVEDEADNRLLLSQLLQSVGFNTRETVNGEEAIQQFQDWQPHLIWMDMRMPVMDGYEATRRIRELAEGKEVKILALTASAFKEQEELILAAGCDAVLHKPYREQALFTAMEKQLNLRYVYDEDSDLQNQNALPKLDAEDLLHLPMEWRDEFLSSAQMGDIDALLSLTMKLPARESEIKTKLDSYINEFQLEYLIKVFEEKRRVTKET